MFIPIVAAIVTFVGAGGIVLSSLVHAGAGDAIFNVASVCLVVGPLIFFGYVIIGLCMEFVSTNRQPGIAGHGPSFDVPVAPLIQAAYDEGLPEGLRRERMGPMNPSNGRAKRT